MKKVLVIMLMVLCGFTLVGSGIGLLLTDDSLILPETGGGGLRSLPKKKILMMETLMKK